MGMLGKLVVGGLVAASVARPALAADWLKQIVDPPPGVQIQSDPIELGTGWYLRGGAGIGQDSLPNLLSTGTSKNLSSWSVDFGLGYKLNNWVRFDATFDMRKVQNASSSTLTLNGAQIICPNGSSGGNNALQALQDGNGKMVGYAWDSNLGTCRQTKTAELGAMALMFNAYVDLGTWAGLTPYVGAGVGVARLHTASSVNYYDTASGNLYAPTAGQWTETGGTPLVWLDRYGTPVFPTIPGTNIPVSIAQPPNWNSRQSSVRYNFAWALMAGLAYDLSDRAKLDLGFRYLNLGNIQLAPGGASSPVTAKEVTLGVRYLID